MSIKRIYVVKENSYNDTILRITVQCFDSEPVITVDRFRVKNSYGDMLWEAAINKFVTPLLIDITTNLRIVNMLDNTTAYVDNEDELKI